MFGVNINHHKPRAQGSSIELDENQELLQGHDHLNDTQLKTLFLPLK